MRALIAIDIYACGHVPRPSALFRPYHFTGNAWLWLEAGEMKASRPKLIVAEKWVPATANMPVAIRIISNRCLCFARFNLTRDVIDNGGVV